MARLGGEEFAVLLPDTSLRGGAALAEKIRQAVEAARIRRAGREEVIGRVTVSIGVAVAHPEDTLDRLVERADAAMYEAKPRGRNRVHVSPLESAPPDGAAQ